MRIAEFNVPCEVIREFALEMTNRTLTNEITGITEDGELEIVVRYEKEEAKEVDKLEEILERLNEDMEEEEEED